MSTFWKAGVFNGAILLLSAGVFLWQHDEGSKTQEELSDLKARRTSLQARRQPVTLLGKQTPAEAAEVKANHRTIRDLLNTSSEPVDAHQLVNGLMDVMMSQDMVGMLRLFVPLAELDHESYTALVDEIREMNGSAQTKEMALQLISMFAPASNPQESIERLMELGVGPHSYSNLITQWASRDPDAAYEWYQDKLEAGELFGKGTQNSPDQILLANLIGGIAQKDTQRALDLFAEIEDKGTRGSTLFQLGNSLAAELRKSGDETRFLELMDLLDDNERTQAVSSAMHLWGADGSLEEGLTFVDRHLDEPAARRSALLNMVMSHQAAPLEEKAEWLLEHTPSEDLTPTVVQLVQHAAWSHTEDIGKWLIAQPRGEARDQGLQTLVDSHLNRQSFDDALNFAERIDNATTRQEVMGRLGQRWMEQNPGQARESLPADLIKSVESANQTPAPTPR